MWPHQRAGAHAARTPCLGFRPRSVRRPAAYIRCPDAGLRGTHGILRTMAAATDNYDNDKSKFFSALICTKSPVLDGQIAQRTARLAVVLFFQAIGGPASGSTGRAWTTCGTQQWNQNPGSDLHVCVHARFSAHRCPQAVHWLCGVAAHCACPRRARPHRAVEALTSAGQRPCRAGWTRAVHPRLSLPSPGTA